MNTKDTSILIAFVLLKFCLQYLLLDAGYDLQRDEYLHLDQANHLAWGYASVPPVTSWISWVIKLLGNGVFWVKLFPALFGALTLVVVWKTCALLGGSRYAKVLGATCVLFSSLLRLNTLYQPNSLDVLCWTATLYLLMRYLKTERPKVLYYTAVVVAIGILNKYNIAFLLLAIIPALLFTPQRKIFRKKELYIAVAIGLLLISPNLWWQVTNHFPVLRHMEELARTQLVNVARADFLKNQLFFFTGALFVILAALYGLFFATALRPYRFLFWTFFGVLALFTYFKAKDYYAIGLYPIYIAIGAVYSSNIVQHKVALVIKPLLLALPVLVFALTYEVAYPNQTPEYIITHQEKYRALGLLHWEDGKDHDIPQDYADMLGWRELAEKVDAAYRTIEVPEQTLILCDNYGQAGAINYYTKEPLKAVSFNADYIHWFELSNPYTNLIRVKNRDERHEEFEKTRPFFESGKVYDSITNVYAREYGTVIFVFENAKIDVNARIQEELQSYE
ncbi:Dolichyl-phosphate-mannose-protein mannosyltransferase [Pustulibacterium marinum]|uniref:Dolichyl-phosphate-mannose-protein mannosyltransferase n=1 Tax=Pustulibacterium marinum TaxID=1224947 RepID=A0A1I7G0G7_9FLAO|nr:glycosyltransferase family 39 protein [Pustulibacterium marinum]SFU41821.1 Dolichyl-phosphate-mannose-protein mannosyltransferase [Pustulibacterium marinum]